MCSSTGSRSRRAAPGLRSARRPPGPLRCADAQRVAALVAEPARRRVRLAAAGAGRVEPGPAAVAEFRLRRILLLALATHHRMFLRRNASSYCRYERNPPGPVALRDPFRILGPLGAGQQRWPRDLSVQAG